MNKTFDPVHELQGVFRKLVKGFSYPGTIHNAAQETVLHDFAFDLGDLSLVLGLMLMDAETSFACNNPHAALLLSRLSYARQQAVKDADFIFTDGTEAGFAAVIEQARCGTLIDPHDSATIITLTGGFADNQQYSLRGPGIQTSRTISPVLHEGWLAAFSEKNREFPLGVDLILVNREHHLMVLPRTTIIRKGAS